MTTAASTTRDIAASPARAEWRAINAPLMSLAEIAESIHYGYTASASQEPIGPKFLRITDIVAPQIDWETVPYCKIEETSMDKYRLRPGDIVIARTGATVGYAKLIRDDRSSIFASYLVRIRIDTAKADPGYVGRVVESSFYKRFVLSNVGGAAQPNANARVLSSFRLPIPPQAFQARIASVLSAYDDLIENNHRRIRLLEQAGSMLYEEWFVRLRFPGYEGTTVINGVPEGWRRTTIGEIAPFKYGKGLRQADRVQGQYPVFGSSGVVGTHATPLVAGPGIVVGRKGNVGSVFWTDNDFYPIDTCYYVDKAHSTAYIYHSLLRTQFINTDVAVPGLNRDFAHSRALLMPDGRTLALFEERALVFRNQIGKLSRQNAVLTEARDLLLPRLMAKKIPA